MASTTKYFCFEFYMISASKVIGISCNLSAQSIMVKTTQMSDNSWSDICVKIFVVNDE